MTVLLAVFTATSSLLWLSTYGYVLVLMTRARGRRRAPAPVREWPQIAVVVPTLNEHHLIAAKLADIARIDYPVDKLHVVVVDGGSVDGTVAAVDAAIAAGAPLTLWRVDARGSKAHQVNVAMERLSQALVVVTDADAHLDPSCVRELVGELLDDPRTAIVGASVRVATDFVEERLHWWGINHLWQLEGEALSAAVVSGVCYAVRRQEVLTVALDAHAEDVHVSLSAASRGLRVRLSRRAWATEVRVPQDTDELLRFRRRRGADYLRELERDSFRAVRPGARIAHAVRLFHFRVTPLLAAIAVLSAIPLLCTSSWGWPVAAAVAFAMPLVMTIAGSPSLRAVAPWPQLVWTCCRWLGLIWVSLITIRVPQPVMDQAPAERSKRVVPSADPGVGT